MKRLPNGISNYKELVEKNRYYVDKTMFLPKLEQVSDFLFFVRPRRFGKSLFLSMMACYYDIEEKDNFEQLFGNTWIGSHPTAEKNKYLIMKFDFSQVRAFKGDYEEGFNDYGMEQLYQFMFRYGKYYPREVAHHINLQQSFYTKFDAIVGAAQELGLPIYLIVDEYDNFTNNVLNSRGEDIYHQLTHGEGFYRQLFMSFKGNFPKILMLGVSPVTLDDLTSGYNIATNITMDSDFNTMLGFSEDDVREMIEYYRNAGIITQSTDGIIQDMKPWYDNYCFAEDSLDRDPKMFNSNMVLYYLAHLIKHGSRPKVMIDPNTRTDYNKMKKIVQLDQLDDARRTIIHHIAEDGYIYGTIVDFFPALSLTKKENYVSLLYYYGMLTIAGTHGFELKLAIPNNNVRKQYYDYLLEEYNAIRPFDNSSLNSTFYDAAIDGNWHPMMEMLCEAYKANSSVRSLIQGERNIQGFFMAYLSLNLFYLTAPEMEFEHGYCDFFLMPDTERYPMVRHAFIIELKYLTADAKDAQAEKQWNDAVAQIRRYAAEARLPHYLQDRQLHLLVVQFKGNEAVRMEEVEEN